MPADRQADRAADRDRGQPADRRRVVDREQAALHAVREHRPQDAGAVTRRPGADIVGRLHQEHRTRRGGTDFFQHLIHRRIIDGALVPELPSQARPGLELRARHRVAGVRHRAQRDARLGGVGKGEPGENVVGPNSGSRGLHLVREPRERQHRVVLRTGAGRRPKHGHAAPVHARHPAGRQAALEQPGRAHGRRLAVGVGVLAVGDQAARVGAHAGRHVAVQVQHAEQRELRRTRQRAHPGQQFTLGILNRLRRHGAVQDQVDRLDAGLQRRAGPRLEQLPEFLEGRVLHRSARHHPGVHRRHHLPAKPARLLEEPRRGGLIALLGQDGGVQRDVKVRPPRGLGQEGVGLVKETTKQNAGLLHGREVRRHALRRPAPRWRHAAGRPGPRGSAPRRCPSRRAQD